MTQKTREISDVEQGDTIGVRYEPVHGDVTAHKTTVLTITDADYEVKAEDNDGDEYVLRSDCGTATEIAKVDSYGNARRNGWVDEVTRMGWVA